MDFDTVHVLDKERQLSFTAANTPGGYGDIFFNLTCTGDNFGDNSLRIREPGMGGGRQLFESFDVMRKLVPAFKADQQETSSGQLRLPLNYRNGASKKLSMLRPCDDERGVTMGITCPNGNAVQLTIAAGPEADTCYGASPLQITFEAQAHPRAVCVLHAYHTALRSDYKDPYRWRQKRAEELAYR